jgi:hypothetical protein
MDMDYRAELICEYAYGTRMGPRRRSVAEARKDLFEMADKLGLAVMRIDDASRSRRWRAVYDSPKTTAVGYIDESPHMTKTARFLDALAGAIVYLIAVALLLTIGFGMFLV